MQSQTCKHLMGLRLFWLSKQKQRLWFDCELDTILPRSKFAYPPAGAPEPPTCITLQHRPATAGLLATAPRGSGNVGGSALVTDMRAAVAPETEAVLSPAAVAVVSRLQRLEQDIAANIRRLRKLHTAESSADVEAALGGAVLQLAEQFSSLLTAGVSSLEASVSVRQVAVLPETEGDVATHAESRTLHRHRGSLLRTRFQQKSDQPGRVATRHRLAGRHKAAADSDEDADVPSATYATAAPTATAGKIAVSLSASGNPATGRHRHRQDKKAKLPRNEQSRTRLAGTDSHGRQQHTIPTGASSAAAAVDADAASAAPGVYVAAAASAAVVIADA